MARRTTSRLDLRRMSEAAEAKEADAEETKPKKKKAAKKTAKRKTAKSKENPRMRVCWAVVNDSMKQVAVFDYPNRKDADEKAAALVDKGKGNHFVLPIKVPMEDPPEPDK